MDDSLMRFDEADRLATLRRYRLLDTPPDARLNQLIEITAAHFNVPISLVSLIDEQRQWFKAKIGVTAQQTSRDLSFCSLAITRPNDVLVIEDAAHDPRFADHPVVQGNPDIRFYAGAPIVVQDGQPLGALCIVDRVPRKLDAEGQAMLRKLAASAASMLELHLSNLTLSEAATRDPVTGLANRRAFEMDLEEAMDGAFAGRPVGLLCIDLDGFKNINDAHGHEIGDALLRRVGEKLSRVMRESDVAARVGGDEFAVLLSGPVDAELVGSIAQRVLESLSGPVSIGGARMKVGASIGAALAPLHAATAAELTRVADEALYAAKRGGRNRVVVSGSISAAVSLRARVSLEEELKRAIKSNALSLSWQPYLRTDDFSLAGFEALARWNRPDGGPVPASIFVPIAESSGLVGELDEWVLREACSIAAQAAEPWRVAVNISSYWLSRGTLVELVERALHATGLQPHRLMLELTERVVVDHPERAMRGMAELYDRGVRFALDDFGVGYSSLGLLQQMPFDKLKIDKRFVAGIGRQGRAEALAGAIVHLGRALEIYVCAEGVETPEQLRFLTGAGCDFLQGNLLGEPAPLPDVAEAKAWTHNIRAILPNCLCPERSWDLDMESHTY